MQNYTIKSKKSKMCQKSQKTPKKVKSECFSHREFSHALSIITLKIKVKSIYVKSLGKNGSLFTFSNCGNGYEL